MSPWFILVGKNQKKLQSVRTKTFSQPQLTILEDRCLLSATLWTQRGGDAGHSGFADILLNAASISQVWNQPLNYLSSGTGSWSERAVAIDSTNVYRTDLEGYAPSGTYHVIAYNLQSGTEVWHRTITGNAFEGVGEPSVANGIVFVNRAGHSGISGGTSADLPRLYGFNAQTGATVVQQTYAAQWASNERPVIRDNQLVAWDGYYGGFSSWNATTLARQWNNPGSIYNEPLAAIDTNYVYAYGNQVYLRTTGVRQADIVHPDGLTLTDAMVSASGRIFYRVAGTVGGVQKYGIAAFDGTTHTHLWTTYTSAIPGGKAVGNGILAVTAGNQLLTLNETSGAVTASWQAPLNLTSEIVLTRSHAFVQTSTSGSAIVYAVNLSTMQQEWSFQNTATGEVGSAYMEIAFGGGHLLLSHDTFVRAFSVTASNQPPDAVNDSATTAEDTSVTINVLGNDTDPEQDRIIVTGVTQPAHGTVILNGNGTVTYTPAANYNGSDSFTYSIMDGFGGTDAATVSLNVTPVNDAPIASLWQFGTSEDIPLVSFLRASDVDGDALTYHIVNGPANGTVQLGGATGAPGAFIYTPNINYYGTDTFTFKVNDGLVDSNIATIFVTVRPVNDAPTAVNDTYTTNEDTPLEISAAQGLLFNDSDVDGDALTVELVSTPTKGTLNLLSDGSFSYQPSLNVNGTDTFTYRAKDVTLSSPVVTVTININAVQDPPIAEAGPNQTAPEMSTVLFDGTASYDVDGDTLSYLWTFGDGGTSTLATPSHAYTDNGLYTVTLIVNDGHGNTTQDTMQVLVSNVAPSGSVSGPTSGVRGQSQAFTFTAQDVSPTDGNSPFTYTINWGDGPLVETLQGSTTLTTNHAYANSGLYTVQVTVTDKDNGASFPVTHNILVRALDVQNNTLLIAGTPGNDTIEITPSNNGQSLTVIVNGVNEGEYQHLDQLFIYGYSGDDSIDINSIKVKRTTYSVGVPAVVDAGDGNDVVDVRGSVAANVLLGGNGNDTIWSGKSNDLVVGGRGVDRLFAEEGEDVLIGGTTDHDNNFAALSALLREWDRGNIGYGDRIDHLMGTTSGGLNGAYFLNSNTVHDDNDRDELYGGNGRDWFLAATSGPWADVVKDRKRNEVVTQI